MNEILECLEHGAGTCRNADMIDELVAELARRDEQISTLVETVKRLKEDGSALAAVCDALKWRCEG